MQQFAAQRVDVLGLLQPGQQQGELIAPQAGHQVAGAHARAQAPRHLAQQFVALVVAKGVVHFFEKVQVEKHQGKALAMQARLFDAVRQVLLEHLPVGQLGQVVKVRLVPDRCLLLAQLGHVGEQADVAVNAAILVVRGGDGQLLNVFLAVFAPVVNIAAPAAVRLQAAPQGLVEGAVVAPGAEAVQALAQNFVCFVAGDAGEGGVDVQHHAVCVGHHHGLARVLVHQAGAAHGGLGALALADVQHHADDGGPPLVAHGGAKNFDVAGAAIGAHELAFVARTVYASFQAIAHALVHLGVGLGCEQARQRKVGLQLVLRVARDLGQLGVGINEFDALVQHVNARHGVVGQAVKHGLDLFHGAALLHHVPQQLLDVLGRLVQRLRQLGQLFAARQLAALGVVAPGNGAALARHRLDGVQHLARQQQVAQDQQQHIDHKQRHAAPQGALVGLVGELHELLHQHLGALQQGIAGLHQADNVGGAVPGGGTQRIQRQAVGLPVVVQGLQRRAHTRVQRLYLLAVGTAAMGQGGVGVFKRLVALHVGRACVEGVLLRSQGLQGNALAQHAHVAGNVQGGSGIVGAAQQQLHGGNVAQRQQRHQQQRPQRLVFQRARPGQQGA